MLDLLYLKKIELLASNHINEEFYNSNDEHAQIVLTSMVRYSKNIVRVYCGNMCTDVSNDPTYLNEIKIYLTERKGSIYILLCDYKDHFKEKPIYKLLSQYPLEQVQIKTTKTLLLYNGNPVHFTVSDDLAFRFETDIVKKMARGNFNDREGAKMLTEKFDNLFLNASSI
jgi:hypothetical protein